MIKIFNYLLNFIKVVLILVSFTLVSYISLFMYKDLNKDILHNYLLEFSLILLPFIILIFIYIYTLISKNKTVNENMYFSLVNFICLSAILVICLRTIFDKNIVEHYLHDVSISYNYFTDYLSFIKVMIYSLIISHLLLIIKSKSIKKKELMID